MKIIFFYSFTIFRKVQTKLLHVSKKLDKQCRQKKKQEKMKTGNRHGNQTSPPLSFTNYIN